MEADSPQSRQRSIIRISNLHYSVDKEQLEVPNQKFRVFAVHLESLERAELNGIKWAGRMYQISLFRKQQLSNFLAERTSKEQ